MAGYSKKSLKDKLGINENYKICIINSPEDYFNILGQLEESIELIKTPIKNLDFIQLFVKEEKTLKKELPILVNSIKQNGMIWISWPKKTSKIKSDLNENIIREIGLKLGLVDIKVCAVNEIWSGLKFVIRKENRTF